MAEINLGNDTNITTTISTDTPISANVPDINYIPGYQVAEEERRANEVIRQQNETNRIALYEDMENKLATGYFDGVGLNYDWEGTSLGVKREDESEYSYTDLKGDTGNDGVSPSASVTRGTGSATITVTDASGTTTAVIYDGEKGDKGDKGDPGEVNIIVVEELPATGVEDTIYLVPLAEPDVQGNNYAEYIYINGAWELLGKVGIATDLTDYVKNTDYASLSKAGVVKTNSYSGFNVGNGGGALCDSVTYSQYEGRINDSFISKGTLENVITGKGLVSSSSLSTVATTGSYNDLTNKPTIPDELADLTDDSTHRLVTDTDKTNWNNKVDSNGNATTTSENTSFNLTNTLEAPLLIDLKGNTSQTGTPTPSSPIPVNVVSGDNSVVIQEKNLWDKSSILWFRNSSSPFDDRYDASTNRIKSTPISIQGGKTYTISGIPSGITLNTGGPKCYDVNRNYLGDNYTSYTNGTFILPNNVAYIAIMCNGENFTSATNTLMQNADIQLEYGSTASTYEAYNGTTYNIDLPVENLFDKDNVNSLNAYFVDGTNNITADTSGNNKTIYIPCQPNTIYTIQKTASPSNRAIGYTTTTPAIGVAVQGAKNIVANTTTNSITTGNNAQYLVMRVWSGTQDTITYNEMLASVQIELGTKTNTYTPYGTTPIELNKIGTYQDYIYKENDKWYLHKEVGKVVLDGSENWDIATATGFIAFLLNNSVSASSLVGLSNYYKNLAGSYWNNMQNNEFIVGRNNTQIIIRNDSISTLDAWKTWLGSNNTSIYYTLSTPTNTEITYTPLIEQLNALEEAQSYEGTTNINQVNNDLPFIINVTVFNDNYNGRYKSLKYMYDKIIAGGSE